MTTKVPEWKQELIAPIERAVYHAAVGLMADEIEEIVRKTLIRAKRDLSS